MKKIRKPSLEPTDLRRRAEERLKNNQVNGGPAWTQEDSARRLHELQIHEIELEIQNEELRESQEVFEAVFDMVNVGMLLIDETGAVQWVNNTLARWVNGSLSVHGSSQPGDYIGCIHALACPEKCGRTPLCNACQIRNTFETALRTGQSIHEVEAEANLSIDGKKVDLWLEISADPLIVDGKRHVILAMNNITARKQAEKERESLLADVEHRSVETEGVFAAQQDAIEAHCQMGRVNSEHALRRAHDELERRVEERTADLRRMSLYARSLIEAGLDPLVTINPEGEITDVNRATELATGLLRTELIGSDFSDYFTEPDKAREGYQRVLAEGQVTDYPLTIRHISGNTIDVLYHATIYRDETGEVQGVFAAARDVTESKRIEQALRDSEKLLADVHRIARLGGWDWNIVADELIWSDEMFRLFGFEPQAFPVNYARFLECVHPDDRDVVIACVSRALEGLDQYKVCYRIILPDTTERILRAQAEVLFNESGLPIRMIGTVLDVSEQVRAEEEAKLRQQQLVQADKMISLGILVSGVAHEINNPNHSILSNVTLLKDVWEDARPILDHFLEDFGDFVLGGFDYVEHREKFLAMFAGTLASSDRIRVIVEELRDFARSNPNEKMTILNADVVVESACILMANMIHKSTDHYEICHAVNLPPVRGNFQRIEQVVINLIQNACRSLPSRDKGIRISTIFVPESEQVVIEVCDEGIGIPEENLKHLGDPFFTTQRAAGGMGLGLWVSFNIVHEHGGTLTYYSESGQGTRAVLALPMIQAVEAMEKHVPTFDS